MYSFHVTLVRSFSVDQILYIFVVFGPCAFAWPLIYFFGLKMESKMPENVVDIESLFASTELQMFQWYWPAPSPSPPTTTTTTTSTNGQQHNTIQHSIRKRYSNRLIKEHLMFKQLHKIKSFAMLSCHFLVCLFLTKIVASVMLCHDVVVLHRNRPKKMKYISTYTRRNNERTNERANDQDRPEVTIVKHQEMRARFIDSQ